MGRPEETQQGSGGDGNTAESLWTVRECADYLRVSESWIYKHVDLGELPHAKLGRALRFHPARVRDYAEKLCGGGGSAKVIPLRGKR